MYDPNSEYEADKIIKKLMSGFDSNGAVRQLLIKAYFAGRDSIYKQFDIEKKAIILMQSKQEDK